MKGRLEALVNRHMLGLARKQSGLDLEVAARRLHINKDKLSDWEEGKARPTIRQAIKLAAVYHRPLSYFYLREAPRDFTVAITDFRRTRGSRPRKRSPALMWEHRRAQLRREIMLDLEEAGAKAFGYLGSISVDADAEVVAHQIRDWLGVSWATQSSWKDNSTAFAAWREAIENLNVLVFHTDYLGATVALDECRGFSISESIYPVIVVNTKDADGGRIFTLLHEFAHLLLNAGGLCDLDPDNRAQSAEQRIEVFCNHVAGAVLVPREVFGAHRIVAAHRGAVQWGDEEIYNLAAEFSVSELVVVRRILVLGQTSQAFYENKQRDYESAWKEFRDKRRGKKRKGGPPVYIMAYRRNGGAFTRQVFDSYHDDVLNLLDVSDYLGVKVKHITRLEDEAYFGAGGEHNG